jgi:hypothetical protein
MPLCKDFATGDWLNEEIVFSLIFSVDISGVSPFTEITSPWLLLTIIFPSSSDCVIFPSSLRIISPS